MKRTLCLTMVALIASTACFAETEGAQEGAPPAAAARPEGGWIPPTPGAGVVTPDQLPDFRVHEDVKDEIRREGLTFGDWNHLRKAPNEAEWRKNQHLSWHADWHMKSRDERYHHLTDPEHTRYYDHNALRTNYDADLARALELAAKEIEMEGGDIVFAEDQAYGRGRATRKHVHLVADDKHKHRWGVVYSNDWERRHKTCIWWIRKDIETVGSRDVPPSADYVVPAPRPVRWNDANHACPVAYETFFTPPSEHTVVVPFSLPREGDWRAHISPGMNKIVDKTDWLRVVREGRPDCPDEPAPVAKPEGD